MGLFLQIQSAVAQVHNLCTSSRKPGDEKTAKTKEATYDRFMALQSQIESREALIDNIEADINIANNDHERFSFQIDLYTIIRGSLANYKKETIATADRRMGSVKNKIETVLQKRLVTMKNDLIRILDNNELLRYETFAGSGENIRYQAGGGEQSKRVPASVLPQSKSLNWQFAGEYWEDEIGHYRSTLKNNCPDSKQASLGGAQ